MKVTVCELPNNWINSKEDQEKLHLHLESQKSDLLLLPEMPFSSWLPRKREPDADVWKKAVDNHDIWLERLTEFNVPAIASSRPAIKGDTMLNVGFVWTHEDGVRVED